MGVCVGECIKMFYLFACTGNGHMPVCECVFCILLVFVHIEDIRKSSVCLHKPVSVLQYITPLNA